MEKIIRSRCRQLKDRQSGFTLLEVMVAIVILTIGLLGTAGLTTGVIKGNRYSKNVTSATAVAQTRLEEIKSGGYANATTTNFPGDTVTMGSTPFTRTVAITNSSPAANMKTVSVTVSWKEANNSSRSVNLQTILAE